MRWFPLFALLAACSTASGPAEVPVVAAGGVVRVPEPPRQALEPDPILVFAVSGEVDGRLGEDRVSLSADGVLAAADASLKIDVPTTLAWAAVSEVRVVDLGGARHGVLVGIPTDDHDEPPSRYRIYLYERGALTLVFDRVIGTYGRTPLLFEGDGTAYYEPDGWSACSGEAVPDAIEQERVRLRLDEAGRELVEVGRGKTGKIIRCDQLAG